MLKINNDYSVVWDDDVTHEQIVNLIVSFYSGNFSRALAQQLLKKDDAWKRKLEEEFIRILKETFEQEMIDLMLNMNKPFFNHLGVKFKKEEPPFVSPLLAFK